MEATKRKASEDFGEQIRKRLFGDKCLSSKSSEAAVQQIEAPVIKREVVIEENESLPSETVLLRNAIEKTKGAAKKALAAKDKEIDEIKGEILKFKLEKATYHEKYKKYKHFAETLKKQFDNSKVNELAEVISDLKCKGSLKDGLLYKEREENEKHLKQIALLQRKVEEMSKAEKKAEEERVKEIIKHSDKVNQLEENNKKLSQLNAVRLDNEKNQQNAVQPPDQKDFLSPSSLAPVKGESLTKKRSGQVAAQTKQKSIEHKLIAKVEPYMSGKNIVQELVSNESSKDCVTELEEVKDCGQGGQREDLLKPVPHLLATPAAVNTGVPPVSLSQMVTADLYICNKCKKSLKSARQLQTHQAFQHGSVEEEEIKCMVMKCGKMFRKTSTLENHMRGHQETDEQTSKAPPIVSAPNTLVTPLKIPKGNLDKKKYFESLLLLNDEQPEDNNQKAVQENEIQGDLTSPMIPNQEEKRKQKNKIDNKITISLCLGDENSLDENVETVEPIGKKTAADVLEEKEKEIVEVLLVEKEEEDIGFSMQEENGLEPDSCESDTTEPAEKADDLKDKIKELSKSKKVVEEETFETTPRAYDELLNRINDKLIEMAKNRS